MNFLNLQAQLGALWFARASYRQGSRSKPESIVIFIAIVLFHLALIVIAFNSKFKQRGTSAVPAFKMIYLSQEKPPDQLELHLPVVEQASIKNFLALPEIVIEEQVQVGLDIKIEQSLSYYELPNKKAGRYKDVFDPKLRKKLEDLPIKAIAKSKIQSVGVGLTVEDIGDGKCIYGDAFNKAGRVVKCGPNEGERMMLNVERALDDPLGLK